MVVYDCLYLQKKLAELRDLGLKQDTLKLDMCETISDEDLLTPSEIDDETWWKLSLLCWKIDEVENKIDETLTEIDKAIDEWRKY